MRGLKFKKGVKRQARVNARVRYIEGDFTPTERVSWEAQFDTVPEPLSDAEKAEFLATLSGVALSSPPLTALVVTGVIKERRDSEGAAQPAAPAAATGVQAGEE